MENNQSGEEVPTLPVRWGQAIIDVATDWQEAYYPNRPERGGLAKSVGKMLVRIGGGEPRLDVQPEIREEV